MRILFISTFYPPHVIGGWEQLVEDLSLGLRARGHETFVLTSTHGALGNERAHELEIGIDRSLLLESNLQFYQPADMFSYRRRVQSNLEATQAAVERWRPDVVFVHIMWNLTRGIPWLAEQLLPGCVVYYVADHWPYTPDTHDAYWRSADGDALRRVFKRMLAPIPLRIIEQDRQRFQLAFQRVLCVSQAIRSALLANLLLDPQRVQVVYNGIDVNAFPFCVRQFSAGTEEKSGPLRLLYAGSLVPHKGVHVAVEAMGELARQGQLARVTLTLVGSGRPDYEARLHDAVVEQGLQDVVRFAGRVARSEMPAQLAAHDVLIFPSEWPEPLARMTQEAMATGAVVIGTTTGGTGEILVDGETGLVFTPGDAHQLAQRVRQLQADPLLFARLANNARRRVEDQFDFRIMLDQVEAILAGVAAVAAVAAPASVISTSKAQ